MKLTKLNEFLVDGKVRKGRWFVGPNHDIQYESTDSSETIKLKSTIVAIEPGSLVLAISEKRADQKSITSLVKLTGFWKTNLKNELLFEVKKENGLYDILTLKGSYEINGSNELVYSYEETELKTKKKIKNKITIKGHWDIAGENRLTYLIEGDSESALRFRASYQTKSILAKKGEIRYQIGFELNGRRILKEFILFGKWVISRDLSLFFEVTYPKKKSQAIRFGGDFSIGKDRAIRVDLRSEKGKPLGLELVFTKDFFKKDAEFFIRLLRTIEESRLESGVRLAW